MTGLLTGKTTNNYTPQVNLFFLPLRNKLSAAMLQRFRFLAWFCVMWCFFGLNYCIAQQSLMSLKQYIGQMPQDFLKQEPLINDRLAKLLGVKDYERLKERFTNQQPIQLVGDVLILLGEKPFAVGNPKAIVGIGLTSNKIHCALVESNGRNIFSEEPQRIPNEFNRFIIAKDKRDKEKSEKEKAEKEKADKEKQVSDKVGNK
jgi:hypothetical protein